MQSAEKFTARNARSALCQIAALAVLPFFSLAKDDPEHLQLARELLKAVTPQTNSYFANPTKIVWPDEATDDEPASNASVCSSFCTALLRKAYRLDAGDLEKLFTEEWPEADEMFVGVSESRRFVVIENIAEAKPGDFIVIDYQSNKEIPTGHVMVISDEVEKEGKHPGDAIPFPVHENAKAKQPDAEEVREWFVSVIDSSKGAHGKTDTRYEAGENGKNAEGVGEGILRLLSDPDGKPVGYSWSTFSNSKVWFTKDRPIVIARWKR